MYIQNECTFGTSLIIEWCALGQMYIGKWMYIQNECTLKMNVLKMWQTWYISFECTFVLKVHSFWMYIRPNAHHSMINDVPNVHTHWMYIRPNAHHLNLLSSDVLSAKLQVLTWVQTQSPQIFTNYLSLVHCEEKTLLLFYLHLSICLFLIFEIEKTQ